MLTRFERSSRRRNNNRPLFEVAFNRIKLLIRSRSVIDFCFAYLGLGTVTQNDMETGTNSPLKTDIDDIVLAY